MKINPNFKALDKLEKKEIKRLFKHYQKALKETRAFLAMYDSKYNLSRSEGHEKQRLKTLEAQIVLVLNEMFTENNKLLKGLSTEQFTGAYYRAAYEVEMTLGVSLNYMALSEQAISNAIANPLAGTRMNGTTWELTLKQSLERNRKDIIRKTTNAIAQGIKIGKGYTAIANDIKKIYENDFQKARLIATTETHRVQEDAKDKAFQRAHDAGVQLMSVWDATLDHKTRNAHRSLDQVKVPFGENFKSPNGGVGPYPGAMGNGADDIRCRCVRIVEVEGFTPEFKAYRDKEGRTQVGKRMPYKEWEKMVA